MKIGVFDSGVGGLSVVKSLLGAALFEEIIYFGDTARVPYGIKDKNTIIRYAIEAVEFFKNFELDLIIVACNTVSAYALKEMREATECPIIGVVESGVLATAKMPIKKDANILILGTQATIRSQAYERELSALGFTNLHAKATGLLVPLVEEQIYNGAIVEAAFCHYFDGIKSPDVVILGCTHFPLLLDALRTYFGEKTLFVHSGDAIVASLMQQFTFLKRYENPKIEFFASQSPDELKKVAAKWLYGNSYM